MCEQGTSCYDIGRSNNAKRVTSMGAAACHFAAANIHDTSAYSDAQTLFQLAVVDNYLIHIIHAKTADHMTVGAVLRVDRITG